MKPLNDSGFGAQTLFFTSLTVALALALIFMFGRGAEGALVAAVAAATVVSAWLAYRSRRQMRSDEAGVRAPFWVSWVEPQRAADAQGPAATSAAGRRDRRSMLPYVGLFALVYIGLVAAAVIASTYLSAKPPLPVYLLFVWIADQVTLRQFAQRVRRPYYREELIALYSGTGLVIVLSEFPTLMAITLYGRWSAAVVVGFVAVGAIVFAVHYFGLSKLPGRYLRAQGL